MRKINSSIRVSEIDTLSDVIVRLYKDAAGSEAGVVAKDANLAQVMADTERLSAEITTAIKSDRAASTLDQADAKRDGIIRSLGDALTGYAAVPIAAKKASAANLISVFGKYGKQITSKNYAEESSLIESLLEDLRAESLKSDIAALDGIADLISSLRTAQDEFNKANDDYTAAKTAKGESATDIKKTLFNVMNNRLVPYLTAVGTIDGYVDFVSKVSAEIDRANATVTARKGKRTEGEAAE